MRVLFQMYRYTVKDIIMKSKSTSCELDPIPTWLLKQCIKELVPAITSVVNTSLLSGTMPDDLRNAVVRPLLKKDNLDHDILKNYQPISNLCFRSKIIERAAASQLVDHMDKNNLGEELQSAYKKFHGIETATLKVQNDIVIAIDHKQCVIMTVLDLSAAFDALEHMIMNNRFDTHINISGTALNGSKAICQIEFSE